jgi:hypothetical protein
MRAALLLVLASASASAPAAPRLAEQWRRADVESRGFLTRTEAARVPRLAAQFDVIDRDADGRITADEVRTWRKASAAARRTAKPGAVKSFLDRADTDGDGLLSYAETLARLPRMAGKFPRMDLDASGWLSQEEIDAWLALRRAARKR